MIKAILIQILEIRYWIFPISSVTILSYMNNSPLISVVIPAYNEEKYLPVCLAAFKNQTFKDFELIVVDNNSKDKTAAIARKYGAKVVKETVQGMIPARERGFTEAKAEIIARTDADTIVTPNWLEVIYDTFQKKPEVVAMTGPWLSPSKRIPDKLTSAYSQFVSVRLGKMMSKHVYLLGPNMALRKSAWRKVKVHRDDRKVHEDIDLSCNLANVGEILYNYRMKVICSYRRVTENPYKGLANYMGEYPIRYIKTLYHNKDGVFNKIHRKKKAISS